MEKNNAQRKIIGISTRVDSYPDRNEQRDSMDQKLVQWFSTSGYIPLLIPNILSENRSEKLKKWMDIFNPDFLVLSGGNDIGSIQNRDETEFFLLDWAYERKKPVLGICRGLQMMAEWSGVKRIPLEGHIKTSHTLTIHSKDESPLWPKEVNSFHQWGIEKCPKDFYICATAEDGAIEAIKHLHLAWEGWMWHPERDGVIDPKNTDRLKALFYGK